MTIDEKYNRYKARKVLKYLIVLFSLLTIALAVLTILKKVNLVFPILSFIVYNILKRYRNKLEFKDNKNI